jgi:tRNA-dihydrouridine synthase C
MEGVVDHTLRAMLTAIGGIDRCVTEFVRVTNHRLPSKVFYRYCPELHTGSKTAAGTPVYIQLLGGQAEPMAMNAQRAAELGAAGIDINFGCPAKLVNRNDGGSVLLKEPSRVNGIISAVRQAVPASTPVTAKIRLGFNDRSLLHDICQAVFDANASELVIHARTKQDGYKPPAFWDAIADIQACSPIPIIANGEIWTPDDYQSCLAQSGCEDIMLGRGLLSRPDLAQQIHSGDANSAMEWLDIIELLKAFAVVTEDQYQRKYVGSRVKQWLAYLRRSYPPAEVLFEQIKRLRWPEEIATAINLHQQSILDEAA